MYLVFILFVMLGTASIPRWLPKVAGLFANTKLGPANPWLPAIAGVLFALAFFLPDIHISDETRTFQQHFVGGGIYSALLYVYFKKVFDWQSGWLQTLIFLFAWTSALGVANELFEFTLTKLQLAGIDSTDADWDLLANTLGAFFGYAMLLFWSKRSVRRQ